jgi:hypothetical protein
MVNLFFKIFYKCSFLNFLGELSKHGNIKIINCEIMGSAKVWVVFSNPKEAKKAFDALNN